MQFTRISSIRLRVIVRAYCASVALRRSLSSLLLLEKKVVVFDVRLKRITHGRIVFGMVDLNEGKGYDPYTGIFPAPTSVCFWLDNFDSTRKRCSRLVVNGNLKSWSHCHDDASKTYVSCGKMTVVKLKQGDKVWIGVFSGTADMRQYTSFLVINCK